MENPEINIEEPAAPVSAPKKRTGFIIGGIVLVIFLAAAAFLAGKLLNRPAGTAIGPGNMGLLTNGEGPVGAVSQRIELTPAPELPQTQPETTGIFVNREDNSIFIGTGAVTFGVMVDQGGSSTTEASYDGPIVEVVITHDTQIFKDATEMPSPGAGSEVQALTQVVEPGSLDDLGEDSLVTVWGRKQGDRILADVILYR
jgi:hypothetical protein